MRVLCINSGSSSLKLAVFDVTRPATDGMAPVEAVERSRVLVERVGRGGPADVGAALDAGLDQLADTDRGVVADDAIDAVAHRIVHGGPHLRSHRVVDGGVRSALDTATAFAPLHLPAELAALDAATTRFAAAAQVVCLDTAFHTTVPEVSWRLPIPDRFTDAGIRRYGFHGINCEHVVDSLGTELGRRAVIAHLGSGASCTAVLDGESVATSMGLTPTGGLVMGTRTGNLDPGVLVHILRAEGLDADGLERLVDRESGLLALSADRSNDVRDLLAAEEQGDTRAALAIEAFVRSAATTVAAQAVVLGGLDTLVFTGGVGEHQATIRRRITDAIDPVLGPFATAVVAADEERMMALHAASLLPGIDAS
jgi:acetate kinase